MRTIAATLAAVAATAATAIGLSSPAHAGPTRGQCGLAMSFICAMIPALPELDHDVDLTQDPNGPNAAGLPPPAARTGGQ